MSREGWVVIAILFAVIAWAGRFDYPLSFDVRMGAIGVVIIIAFLTSSYELD